jgi:hypothetical protein
VGVIVGAKSVDSGRQSTTTGGHRVIEHSLTGFRCRKWSQSDDAGHSINYGE